MNYVDASVQDKLELIAKENNIKMMLEKKDNYSQEFIEVLNKNKKHTEDIGEGKIKDTAHYKHIEEVFTIAKKITDTHH